MSMLCIAFCFIPNASAGPDSFPVPNGFNYQGVLEMNGERFTGFVDIQFNVYEGDISRLYAEIFHDVEVIDGLFQLHVNLATFDFNGNPLQAELEVRTPPGSGPYTTLSPRQDINSVPYAMRATTAEITTTSRSLNLPTTLSPFNPDSELPALTIDQTMITNGGAALRLIRGTNDNEFEGYVSRVLEIESADTLVGLLATADLYPIAGLLDANAGNGGAAILGQVNPGAINHTAIQALNQVNFTQALLATRDYAAFMLGEVRVNGDITQSYAIGSYDLAAPIAYGFVDSNGSITTGTPNFSCVYNPSLVRYEIEIDNENYYFLDYVSVVTSSSSGVIAATSSASGRLTVTLRNSSGTNVAARFQFVTYKPSGAASVEGSPRPPIKPLMTPNDTDLHQHVIPLPNRIPIQDPKATPLQTNHD